MGENLQIVSFQWPIPANYGGVIDVYYKLLALQRLNVDFTLHSYAYRDRRSPDISLSPAGNTFIYPRETALKRALRTKPYIIDSRRDELLYKRLATLPAGTPILYEGLHTTAFLDDAALADKLKIVRTHNVEHEYYRLLAKNSSGLKKIYLHSEALKLARYEKILHHADIILAISPDDAEYFSKHYPKAKTIHLPCFYDDADLHTSTPLPLSGDEPKYILYHGNLAVEENVEAVKYIIKHLLPLFGESFPLKVAGRDCETSLRLLIEHTPNAQLIDSPSIEEMNSLIANASITLLITNQNTGIKLKLLDTIAKARGNIIASKEMVGDPVLGSLLRVANTPSEQRLAIKELLNHVPDVKELQFRRDTLRAAYDNDLNAQRILSLIRN